MFKKLKSQVQEAVNNAALTLTSTNSVNHQDTTSEINTPSVRSRKNSYSSVASDSATSIGLFGNYSTPQRKYYPPSDVESEIDTSSNAGDWQNDQQLHSPPSHNSEIKKLNTLLDIYKKKYSQLKNAYGEVESEKEKIKVSTILK